ncbi:uncharacterized protein LOC141576068 isoform X2 [Camelus bactrianus]|uniref:Uncharacterized protein LOC141576068 isoform X2 n=2 Tax=Camelus bactrianus TaxID=9837 RepID=A0AC58PX64_CAMBA
MERIPLEDSRKIKRWMGRHVGSEGGAAMERCSERLLAMKMKEVVGHKLRKISRLSLLLLRPSLSLQFSLPLLLLPFSPPPIFSLPRFPSVSRRTQSPERIAGPPAHAHGWMPAGPRDRSSSSEPGISPCGCSALSPCRPLAPAPGRGLRLCPAQWHGRCSLGLRSSGCKAQLLLAETWEKRALSMLLSPPSVFLPQLSLRACVRPLSSVTILLRLVAKLGLRGSRAAHFLPRQPKDTAQCIPWCILA